MLKLVAPALAVVAAIYFMKYKKHHENDADRINDAYEAGAYPGE